MRKFLLLALLFSFSAGAQSLPPLPKSIPTQLGPVPVVMVVGLKCFGEDAFGCYDAELRVVSIRDSIPLLTQWHTYYHERIHVAFWDSGAHSLIADEKIEDTIADMLASFSMAELLNSLRRPK